MKEFKLKLEEEIFKPIEKVPDKFKNILLNILNGGKRLRPCLVFASFKSAKGEDIGRIIPVASAIEYIHRATLLLDDLPYMDDSDERDGKPSSYIRYGEAPTVLAACYLVNLSYEKINEVKLLKVIPKEVNEVIVGQLMDLDYLKNIEPYKKTYPLFSLAAEVGGILAGASEENLVYLKKVGKEIGNVIQANDDYQDKDIKENKSLDYLNKAKKILSSSSLEKKYMESYFAMIKKKLSRK